MTVPRELRLRQLGGDIRLVQQPVAELERLRGPSTPRTNQTLSPGAGLWHAGAGAALEILMTIEPGTAAECGVRVVAGDGEQTTIGYDAQSATLFVDRTHAGNAAFRPAFPGRHGGPLTPVQGAITLRIFLDRSSAEAFGNDGECVVTSLIFPTTERQGLEFYAQGGTARLLSLAVYPLQPKS
jgi:fructan beta-fructosidase